MQQHPFLCKDNKADPPKHFGLDTPFEELHCLGFTDLLHKMYQNWKKCPVQL